MPGLSDFPRRRLLAATLGALVLPLCKPVRAQVPLPLTIIAPAGAGGGWDTAARALQQVLNVTGIARNVKVTNIPGAGGTLGLDQFAGSAGGDGDQLLMTGFTMVGAVLVNRAPTGLDALTPIARLTDDPLVVVVPADAPYKTLSALAAALKTDTGKIVWAGGSAGGPDHILAGLMTKAAGGNPAKLDYRPFSGGGDALAELLSGRVTAGISGYNEFESQIKAGKLRALGVSTAQRIDGVAVPTLKEGGLNVTLSNWRGVMGGPGLNEGQRAALSSAVYRALRSPEWARIRQARKWTDAYLSPEDFAAFLKAEQIRVREALSAIGLVK